MGDWLHERIGRLKERYARVARLYDIGLAGAGAARRLRWQLRPERHAWHEARAGAYRLRTNLTATDPATLWTLLLETADGRTLRFRRVSRPDAAQHRLLDILRLSLPERLGVDAECRRLDYVTH